jgi:hypothetical protein
MKKELFREDLLRAVHDGLSILQTANGDWMYYSVFKKEWDYSFCSRNGRPQGAAPTESLIGCVNYF